MHVYHIHSKKDMNKINKMNELIENGSKVFILVYMEGCGPCNATRPEWAKLESALKNQYAKNNSLVIIDINKDLVSDIKHIGSIDGFPTMKYIGDHGKEVETYENSSVSKKDRSIDSFINWVENKINTVVSTTPTSSPYKVYNRIIKTKKHNKNVHNKSRTNKNKNQKQYKGGKWSRKYKKSINCNRPKGFSQKQYCKYGQNKI
jgi:thiol-disulfide isomerase/thioredoxin